MIPQTLNFTIPVSIPQLLIPEICTGILFYGFALYIYMAYRYKSRLYLSIAILAFMALGFVGNETMVIVYGAIKHMRHISVNFHRFEQLAGAFFLFALPYTLSYLLKLSPAWQKFNLAASYTGLAVAVIITIIAFAAPDLFISSEKTYKTWLISESDFGRGQEGIVYTIRDLLIAVYIIYSLSSITADIIINKRLSNLALPASGLFIAIYGAIDDMQYIYTGFSIDPWYDVMFSRFSLGLTVMVILFMAELMRRFITSSKDLEIAHQEISASEKRYRFIIEGTNDAIFSLDRNLKFVEANRAAFDRLPIDRNDHTSTSFHEVIHKAFGDSKYINQVIEQKIRKLVETKQPVNMKLGLVTRKTGEPCDYNITFEHINHSGKEEILVKAVTEQDDILKKYVDFEKGRFCIDNYILAAEEISKRLVQNLPDTMNHTDVMSIRLGLREILINAIEHGNLEITFEEKTSQMDSGDYLLFIQKRQEQSKYAGRKITVEFMLDGNRAVYKIADEGKGFDHKSFIKKKQESMNEELAHGRGISMALNIFDEVKYNKKGNQVLLVKKLF
jgi:anti-sigma regulatory factor (Ser/Thr protein kinase)/PAS domain-containing protein